MPMRKHLVKDQNRTFEDKLVTFAADVPGRVLCALCGNICSEFLADPDDHLYCRPCLGMLDNDGVIDCCIDSATYRIEDMQNRSEIFQEALKLKAMCPSEACSYQGTLREVMGHYKHCKTKVVRCPLCQKEISTNLVHHHISNVCEQRPLFCPFCSLEVVAIQLQAHMEDCDQRPATCDNCQTDFDTFAEMTRDNEKIVEQHEKLLIQLKNRHMAVCPAKPVKCPYARLGCNFQASNKEMEKHVCSCQHLTSLVNRVLDLEVKLQEVRTENEQLRQLIAEKEEVLKKTDEYFRANMMEDLEELRTEVLLVQNRAFQTEPQVAARLRALEDKHAILEEPLEKLLAEIARAK